MYEIVIDKKFENITDRFVTENVVREIISKKSELRKEIQELEEPLSKTYTKIYEVKNEGTILHRERYTLESFDSHLEISLIGFNEDGETFMNLRSKLKKIAETYYCAHSVRED